MGQFGNRISMGFIPVDNADNAKIPSIIVAPDNPIRLIQRTKCISADPLLKVAWFESNGPGLGDVPPFPGSIHKIGMTVLLDNTGHCS